MLLFLFPQFKKFSNSLKKIPESKTGRFTINRLHNLELYIKLSSGVKNRNCLITGSITPPDENLLSFLILAHTLKKEGASKITALLPYLAYARQDKFKKGESLAIGAIAELLRASHINDIATIDLPNQKAESLFPMSVHNLHPFKLFAREIKSLKLKNPTFVAPDEGAKDRVQKVINQLGIKTEIAFMKKERNLSGVKSVLYGHINKGKDAVIIDDILDTGGTLLACCEILKCAGVKDIYIFVTHGLFTGNEWQHLFDFNVKRIYCTDSVPSVASAKFKDIKVLSIKPILGEYTHYLKRIHEKAKKETSRTRKEDLLFFEDMRE